MTATQTLTHLNSDIIKTLSLDLISTSKTTKSQSFQVNNINLSKNINIVDEKVRAALKYQVEFYFSPGNLSRDVYLKSHMDSEFYVSVDIISQFKKVINIYILHSLSYLVIFFFSGARINSRSRFYS
jgi:hypothetical protein